MNMILHNYPTALILQGNTLADPKFLDGDTLKTFAYVVANPPFSDKRWTTGVDPLHDPHKRFQPSALPPPNQATTPTSSTLSAPSNPPAKAPASSPTASSSAATPKPVSAAPSSAKARLHAIIGLPPNLFYGTTVPACIVVVDKQNAHTRKAPSPDSVRTVPRTASGTRTSTKSSPSVPGNSKSPNSRASCPRKRSKRTTEISNRMVFDNNPIDGAERLSDALKKLGQLG